MVRISICSCHRLFLFFFFFTAPATTEIYTLSLHDALPISVARRLIELDVVLAGQQRLELTAVETRAATEQREDRKSTRLNSSHGYISYAVFCLKKKIKTIIQINRCED